MSFRVKPPEKSSMKMWLARSMEVAFIFAICILLAMAAYFALGAPIGIAGPVSLLIALLWVCVRAFTHLKS